MRKSMVLYLWMEKSDAQVQDKQYLAQVCEMDLGVQVDTT